jgi:hypothetical protein
VAQAKRGSANYDFPRFDEKLEIYTYTHIHITPLVVMFLMFLLLLSPGRLFDAPAG